MQIELIKRLLDKLELIRLFQDKSRSIESFNIFTILRSESDEVNLHSRFLYELLNPKGSHGMGNVFLRRFAKICKLPKLNYNCVQVLREYANIDILIQDNQYAVVIENKIYARDQYEQLKRYHQYTTKSYRKPTLLYLTLNGKKPSDLSIGSLEDKIQLISYDNQIGYWLESCIKKSATQPVLRETLVQYQSLVNSLTSGNMNNEEKNGILALMKLDNNAEQAVIIARNWEHVRWHTEWDFWSELDSLVKTCYTILPDGKYSEDAVDKMVHQRRGKNPWYGLSFCIGSLYGNNVNFRIERNEGPMYYGFLRCSDDDTIYSDMRNAIHLLVNDNSQSWVGLKTTNNNLNFESFSNTSTLQLVNPEKREKVIDNLWQEIQEFITSCIKDFQERFGSDFMLINKY